jgi:glutathione S-transferase
VHDDGQLLTEDVAILCWIAERSPQLTPRGELGRIRLIEMLVFIATELHRPFIRALFPTSDAKKVAAEEIICRRLGFVADRIRGGYLFGREFSLADAYLYVMLRLGAEAGAGSSSTSSAISSAACSGRVKCIAPRVGAPCSSPSSHATANPAYRSPWRRGARQARHL